MKYAVLSLAILGLLTTTSGLASQQTAMESYLNIVEPQGGLYYFGQNLIPGDPFWTIIIGMPDIEVEAEASTNVVTVYFTLYDVQERDTIAQYLDTTPSDGFTCTFSDIPRGTLMIIAVGLAADFDDPIASDWRTPIVVIPILQ